MTVPAAWQSPFRRSVAGLTAGAPAAVPNPDEVHLLVPAERWDWEAMPTGETAQAQIAFCDTIPASCAPGSDYAAGSDSFSDAYAAFVELLVDFSLPSLLAAARAALVEPAGDPASTPSPPGWTKTLDGAGMLRWTLDWIVPTTPAEWSAEHGDRPLQGVTLDAAPSVRLLDGADRVVDVPTASGEPLELSAAGWSRVPVYPGSWYSGSTVRLGRDGPFAGGRVPSTVVGRAGILRCRVAELIVAERLSATAALARADDAAAVAAAREVWLGPVAAGAADAQVDAGKLTVATPAGQPYLVGVVYARP